MASIFLSHSSKDNEFVAQIAVSLRKLGYDDIFLDFDKTDGISPGMNWKGELTAGMKRSQIVILLVSDHWFVSVWCQAEYAAAVMMGKQIVPVVIAVSEQDNLQQLQQALQAKLGDVQFVDLIHDPAGGFARLEVVLHRSRVTPFAFDVKPEAAPYKGLRAYAEEDDGLFFGRERETQECLELLRQLAAPGNVERLLVILGASGAGKSSLVRAGLWPQLRLRPREWIRLEPMIPHQSGRLGITPISRMAESIAATFARYDQRRSPSDLTALLQGHAPEQDLLGLADNLRELTGGVHATVVFAVDQAEELLRAEASEQARFLEVFRRFLNLPGFIAALTVRSDTFGALQELRLLEGIPFVVHVLAPMPLSRISDIIRGPASRTGLRVSDALVDQAIQDAQTGDALPLLSFTLERLWREHRGESELTLVAYEKLASSEHGTRISPIEHVVRLTAEDTLGNVSPPEANALAEAFVPGLVDLTDSLEPIRRRASWDSMPQRAAPLLKKLVEARLLTSSSGRGEGADGENILEVAHEALLRRWPTLISRIEAAKPDLRFLQDVERAAADWRHANDVDQKLAKRELRHQGRRLARARTLVGRAGWRERLGQSGNDYIKACVGLQQQRIVLVCASVLMMFCAIAAVSLYRRSDYYAVRDMLAANETPWIFVKAGDRSRALTLLQGKSSSSYCSTGVMLLKVGAGPDAKNFISLALEAVSKQDSDLSGELCLDQAFLVGLGDKVIELLSSKKLSRVTIDGRREEDSISLNSLSNAFTAFSTNEQFDTVLKLASTRNSVDMLAVWLMQAPRNRRPKIISTLHEWRESHEPPFCEASAQHEKTAQKVMVSLSENGYEEDAAKFAAYNCDSVLREEVISPEQLLKLITVDESRAREVQIESGRSDWLVWSGSQPGTNAQFVKPVSEGKCEALPLLLSNDAALLVPNPEEAVRRLLAEINGTECDNAIYRVHLVAETNQMHVGDWPLFFAGLRKMQGIISKEHKNIEVVRKLYWDTIKELTRLPDTFPYIQKFMADRQKFLLTPDELPGEGENPLFFTIAQGAADALQEELTTDKVEATYSPLRRRFLKGESPLCKHTLSAVGLVHLGNRTKAREVITRAQKTLREYRAKNMGRDTSAVECIINSLAAMGEDDDAESLAQTIRSIDERDQIYRDLAIQQAALGSFRRARDSARQISSIPEQRGVEEEILSIWSEAGD